MTVQAQSSVLWLFQPGRQPMLSAVRLGCLTGAVSNALWLLIVMAWLPPSKWSLQTDLDVPSAIDAIVVAPLIETLPVVALFYLFGRYRASVYFGLVTGLASWAHAVTNHMNFIATLFATMLFGVFADECTEWTRRLGYRRAYWGVAATHATHNLIAFFASCALNALRSGLLSGG